jgi:hypothetical protein
VSPNADDGTRPGSGTWPPAKLAAEPAGYTATRHQREVGTGYFDLMREAIARGAAATAAMAGSTEEAQCAHAHR